MKIFGEHDNGKEFSIVVSGNFETLVKQVSVNKIIRLNVILPAKMSYKKFEPLNLDGMQWVIVGGESGPKARPMRPEWALAIRDQCQAVGVAFTFKQWGTWGADGVRRDKKANGRLLAGRLWNEQPEITRTLL